MPDRPTNVLVQRRARAKHVDAGRRLVHRVDDGGAVVTDGCRLPIAPDVRPERALRSHDLSSGGAASSPARATGVPAAMRSRCQRAEKDASDVPALTSRSGCDEKSAGITSARATLFTRCGDPAGRVVDSARRNSHGLRRHGGARRSPWLVAVLGRGLDSSGADAVLFRHERQAAACCRRSGAACRSPDRLCRSSPTVDGTGGRLMIT